MVSGFAPCLLKQYIHKIEVNDEFKKKMKFRKVNLNNLKSKNTTHTA